MKKLICAVMAIVTAVFLTYSTDVKAGQIGTSAQCAILMDADSGEILYEKNADKKCAVASITKIMTAVIALEYAAENDKAVRFTPEMAAEGSSMYLKNGEILKLSEIVKGMMAVSGNDAANAAAFTVAGSIEGFSALMNEKAKQLGMKNTNFVTPSGLDDENHYSTARDMALLCCYAMKNDDFKKIVSQKSIDVSYIFPEGKTQTCVNHNKLLSTYKGCIGIKTGFTKKAGRTLTSCAERDGVRLIAVTLDDGNDWNDHKELFNYGFSLYESRTLVKMNDTYKLPVVGSDIDYIEVHPEKDCSVPLRKGSTEIPVRKIYMPHFVYAPVVKGTYAGEVCYYSGKRKLLSVRLISGTQAEYCNGQ